MKSTHFISAPPPSPTAEPRPHTLGSSPPTRRQPGQAVRIIFTKGARYKASAMSWAATGRSSSGTCRTQHHHHHHPQPRSRNETQPNRLTPTLPSCTKKAAQPPTPTHQHQHQHQHQHTNTNTPTPTPTHQHRHQYQHRPLTYIHTHELCTRVLWGAGGGSGSYTLTHPETGATFSSVFATLSTLFLVQVHVRTPHGGHFECAITAPPFPSHDCGLSTFWVLDTQDPQLRFEDVHRRRIHGFLKCYTHMCLHIRT